MAMTQPIRNDRALPGEPLRAALKISLQHVPPLVPYARLTG
jgi:hypothetical protein